MLEGFPGKAGDHGGEIASVAILFPMHKCCCSQLGSVLPVDVVRCMWVGGDTVAAYSTRCLINVL